MHYNKNFEFFYDKFSNRCLLVSVYSIAHKITSFIDAINAKFQVNLVNLNQIFMTVRYFILKYRMPSTLVGYYFPQALVFIRN